MLQRQVACADKRLPREKIASATQSGARHYPEPPFSRQHKAKPGQEALLDPPPMYEAAYYQGSTDLLLTIGTFRCSHSNALASGRAGAGDNQYRTYGATHFARMWNRPFCRPLKASTRAGRASRKHV